MRVLLQFIINSFTIELGLYTGITFGFRTFEPNEYFDDYQIHLYIPLIYIALIKNIEDSY